MTTIFPVDVLHLLPVLLLGVFAVLTVLADAFTDPRASRDFTGWLALSGIGLAVGVEVLLWAYSPWLEHPLFGGMAVLDHLAVWVSLALLALAAIVELTAVEYLREHDFAHGEFHSLLLCSLAGALLLTMATDLVMLFVALELMSIASYVLVGFLRHTRRGVEAAQTYFLTGSFASAVLLFGLALLYGETADTSYLALFEHARFYFEDATVRSLAGGVLTAHPALVLGMLLLLTGFAFKLSAAPFHLWTADVYRGASPPAAGFLASVVKVAAFTALFRLLVGVLEPLYNALPGWGDVLWLLSLLSMAWGTIAAVRERNLARMLAYSSIAHGGYLMMALISAAAGDKELHAAAYLFYLAVYGLSTLGLFACMARCSGKGASELDTDETLSGLGWRDPLAGAAMVLFLMSLAGLPPTGGFMAKYFVFSSALDAGFLDLAVVGVLTSLISFGYYLKTAMTLYARPAGGLTAVRVPGAGLTLAVTLCALAVLVTGLSPDVLLTAAREAASAFFSTHWLRMVAP